MQYVEPLQRINCHTIVKGVTELTLELIEVLLLQLSGPFVTNSPSEIVPNDKMVTICKEEKKHVNCIQNPDRIILYIVDDTIVVETKENYIKDGLDHLGDTNVYHRIEEDINLVHCHKGWVELPVFQHARGTTSLELLHLHMASQL